MALVDNTFYVDGSTGIAVTDLSSTNTSAGATVTLSVTVPSGALIVVIASEVTSASAGTCADATNGAYTVASSGAMSGAAGFGTVFYFPNSAALSAVTITYTKQTSGRSASISVFYVTGILTVAPLDGAVTATTAVNSATPTVTAAGAPAVSGELIVGACAYSNAAAKTLTNTGSFITPFTNNTGQATASCGGGHINAGGTLAPVFNPTLSGASDNITFVLGFKPSGSLVGWWNVTPWAASTTYVTGTVRRQNATPNLNAERVFVCVASTAGTGQSAATEPAWTTTAQCTRGAKFTDNTVTWQEATGVGALNGDLTNTPLWSNASIKNAAITLGQVITNVAGTLILICTTAGTAGNGAEPSWAAFTNAGATTADNSVTWTTLGASFSSWAAPHARLANAFTSTWGQAGNSFYVASEHAETQNTAVSLVSPGTNASPCLVYCVTKTTVPPASANLTTGASIKTTGNVSITFTGSYGEFQGFTLAPGSSSGTASVVIGAAGDYHRWDNCIIQLGSTGAGGRINVGNATQSIVVWNNVTVQFNATTQTLLAACQSFLWKNTASAVAGATLPTTFMTTTSSGFGNILLEGVDLSALGAGKTLLGGTGNNDAAIYTFKDCKLGASVTIAAQTTVVSGIKVNVIRSDSSGTNYRHEKDGYYTGGQVVDTTIVRTGGASDGTTTLSWKVVSTANSKWVLPFECIPITFWNTSTSAITTLTIYGTTTGGGVPKDDEIWADVVYLVDAGDPLGGFKTSSKADNLAASAATNNSADGSTWAGGGAGNGFKIVLPSFTPAQAGPITIYLKIAKATATYYIDPKPSISGVTVSKSYIAGPTLYANELSSGGASAMAYRNHMRGNLG